jgi:hypothetical protein
MLQIGENLIVKAQLSKVVSNMPECFPVKAAGRIPATKKYYSGIQEIWKL